jgi:PAS domain S-box-containing protein
MLLLAIVFVVWSIWLIVTSQQLQHEAGVKLLLVTKLERLEQSVRDLERPITRPEEPLQGLSSLAAPLDWSGRLADVRRQVAGFDAEDLTTPGVREVLDHTAKALPRLDQLYGEFLDRYDHGAACSAGLGRATVCTLWVTRASAEDGGGLSPAVTAAICAALLESVPPEPPPPEGEFARVRDGVTATLEQLAQLTRGQLAQMTIELLVERWYRLTTLLLVSCFFSIFLALLSAFYQRDLIRLRLAEGALRASEEKYRTLAEAGGVGIWQVTPDGRTIYANPAMCALLEIDKPEELAGRTYHDFFPQHSQAVIEAERAKRPLGTASTYEVELVGRRGRRRVVVISGAPLLGPDGQLHSLIGTFTDVTEHRRAESALREIEAKNRALVNAIPDLMFRIRRDGTYLDFKAPPDAALRPPPEGFVGRKVYDVLPAEAARQSMEHIERALATGEIQVYEFQLTLEGQERDFEARVVVSGPDEVLTIVRDVTDRKRLEAQLLQAQKMEAIGRLAGGVAHDFNNMLTAILGFSELLLRTQPRDDPGREYVEEIYRAGERAATLTRQLLAFSRKQVLLPRVLDLNAVVLNMDRMLRRVLGEDITLETDLDPELRPIKADPGQVEQVLLNLAVNARDAMPQGGRIRIVTANAELSEAEARAHPEVQPGPYVLLAVTDTGCGMDEATQARIFEPFFTTKEPGKGTGLGLAMVYGIVKQSGGHISVRSAPGEGSTFEVYLPCVAAASPPADAPPAGPPPRGTETVLLVEDEEAVRTLACQTLEQNGYTVLVAPDGTRAVQLAQQYAGPIHLLVTDVVMPSLGGRELANHLTATRSGLRVLYISGYADDAIFRHGLLSPGVAFLQKPFSPDALALKVREVLDAAG